MVVDVCEREGICVALCSDRWEKHKKNIEERKENGFFVYLNK
jgi:hypothetical protein